jgi:hypothetical protein
VFPVRYEHHLHMKSKVIPVIGCESLLDCQMLAILHCFDSRLTDIGAAVSLTSRPRSTP